MPQNLSYRWMHSGSPPGKKRTRSWCFKDSWDEGEASGGSVASNLKFLTTWRLEWFFFLFFNSGELWVLSCLWQRKTGLFWGNQNFQSWKFSKPPQRLCGTLQYVNYQNNSPHKTSITLLNSTFLNLNSHIESPWFLKHWFWNDEN